MAKKRETSAGNSAAGQTVDVKKVERKVVELAGQLGWFVGTLQARAENLLENPQLNKKLIKVRDGANELLKLANRATVKAQRTARAGRTTAKRARARTADGKA